VYHNETKDERHFRSINTENPAKSIIPNNIQSAVVISF